MKLKDEIHGVVWRSGGGAWQVGGGCGWGVNQAVQDRACSPSTDAHGRAEEEHLRRTLPAKSICRKQACLPTICRERGLNFSRGECVWEKGVLACAMDSPVSSQKVCVSSRVCFAPYSASRR